MRLMIAMLLLGVTPAFADPPMGSPPGIAPAVAMTDRPATAVARDASRRPVEVLKFLGLKRGDRVLDVMTGGGYYAEIMGNAIGGYGTVLAQEAPVFVDEKFRQRFAELVLRVPNVTLIEVMPGDLKPPTNAYDFVLMHLVYHDFYWSNDTYKFPRIDPAVVLKRIYGATKPGGIVGVVDHVATPGGDVRAVVDKLHRIDPARIKADFEAAGFMLEAESHLLRRSDDPHTESAYDGQTIQGKTDRVLLRFRKPSTAAR